MVAVQSTEGILLSYFSKSIIRGGGGGGGRIYIKVKLCTYWASNQGVISDNFLAKKGVIGWQKKGVIWCEITQIPGNFNT